MFVIKTDVINNIVYVGEGKDHPGLFKKVLFIKNKNFHGVRTDIDYQNSNNKYESRIRYRHAGSVNETKVVIHSIHSE